MAEARELVTEWPYSLVRHPLYLAEAIAVLGLVVQNGSLPAVLLFITMIALQIQRMRYEEVVLESALPQYSAYMGQTHRLIPGVY